MCFTCYYGVCGTWWTTSTWAHEHLESNVTAPFYTLYYYWLPWYCFDGLWTLVSSKWKEFPNPGKNHALVWFMIAVKTSEFSPRRVNKHHRAGSAMCVLMCKDPTGLFDTLLRFSSPFYCPLHPCTSMPPWPFGLWALTPKPWRLLKGGSQPPWQSGNIWPPDWFPQVFSWTPNWRVAVVCCWL